MREDRYLRRVIRLLWIGLVLAAVWAGARWVLPWLAPFLVAVVLAWLLEPVVGWLIRSLRLPRRWAAALCVLAAAGAAGGLAALLAWRLWYELMGLLGRLPGLLTELNGWAEQAEVWLYRLFVALPAELREPARQAVEEAVRGILAFPSWAGETLAEGAGGLLTALPAAGLFLFTAFLATYFLMAGRPGLQAAAQQLPTAWQERMKRWRRAASGAAGSWLRAQGILILLTFGELSVGLLVLRVEPALLLAGMIALVDALPIFGSGIVLLPWSLASLLAGRTPLGLGLLLLYGMVTLVRGALEPRLLGKRIGLPPLVSLVSMYVGFQTFGVAGMILMPVLTMIAWQIWLDRDVVMDKKEGRP